MQRVFNLKIHAFLKCSGLFPPPPGPTPSLLAMDTREAWLSACLFTQWRRWRHGTSRSPRCFSSGRGCFVCSWARSIQLASLVGRLDNCLCADFPCLSRHGVADERAARHWTRTMADSVSEIVWNMLFKVLACAWTMCVFLEAVTTLDCDGEMSIFVFHD